MIHGKKHWIFQRLLAVLILPLIVWFLFSIKINAFTDYQMFLEWIRNPLNSVLLIILLIFSSQHFQLGIQVVLEDYVSVESKRLLFIYIINFLFSILCIFGILAIILLNNI